MYARGDRFGTPVPKQGQAEATADYLEQVQWGPTLPPTVRPQRTNIIGNHDAAYDASQITLEEVSHTCATLKRNKTPGPDKITHEMMRSLDEDNLQMLTGKIGF